MRAKVSIKKLDNQQLSYDYQYYIASMLLSKLRTVNFELASELHSSVDFKYYTFSWLQGKMKHCATGLDFHEAWFVLSSPDPTFIRSFSEGLLNKPECTLGRVPFCVTGIEIMPKREIGKKSYFRTLSPMYVKTQREMNGQLRTWDLYPKDGKFYINLHMNLLHRFEHFHGREPVRDDFDILTRGEMEAKRVRIRDSMRRCSLFHFEVEGSEELLQFGYEAGFGEKTAMGFGCVEVVERIGGDLRGKRGTREY